MVERTLSKKMIEKGKRLLEILDAEKIKTDAALWLYFPAYERWKLLIAKYDVGDTGPMEIYRKIRNILERNKEAIQDMQLFDVVLAKPEEPLLKLLRIAVKTGPGISGIRFRIM